MKTNLKLFEDFNRSLKSKKKIAVVQGGEQDKPLGAIKYCSTANDFISRFKQVVLFEMDADNVEIIEVDEQGGELMVSVVCTTKDETSDERFIISGAFFF